MIFEVALEELACLADLDLCGLFLLGVDHLDEVVKLQDGLTPAQILPGGAGPA